MSNSNPISTFIIRRNLNEADIIARLAMCYEDYDKIDKIVKQAKKERIIVVDNIMIEYHPWKHTFNTAVQMGTGKGAFEVPATGTDENYNSICNVIENMERKTSIEVKDGKYTYDDAKRINKDTLGFKGFCKTAINNW